MLAQACEGLDPRALFLISFVASFSARQARRRGRLRARHHRLDGATDRGRQAQNLVDRHVDRRRQSRTPKSAWAWSPTATSATSTSPRYFRSPRTSRTSTPTCWSFKRARRRRLAGERQRGAACRRHQADLDAGRRSAPHHVPGRRRAAAHGLRAGRQIPRSDEDRAGARHHRQRGAGRRRARHRAGVARDRADGPWPLHPDPAGRRPDRDHRDAIRHRDSRAAGPHQRHGHSVWPAPPALGRRSRRPSNMPRRRGRSPRRWPAT